MPDGDEGAAAAGEAEDEEVIIEELGPDGAEVAPPPAAKGEAAGDDAAGEPADDEEGGEGKGEENPVDTEMQKVEKEKKTMTPEQKLERSQKWKAEGNECWMNGEVFKAADCYYHAILYSRELMQNPQYYPELKHTAEHRKSAQAMCESVFTNLALVQAKYGGCLPAKDPERGKVLEEAVKSATEALKINAKNVKALFRRAQARSSLAATATNAEAQQFLTDAKADLMAIIQEDAQNREARSEVKTIQDRLKQLKKEELAGEKKNFAFGSTLSALGAKEKDILGDGSIRKLTISPGDGGLWMNEDWLPADAPVKCVAHVRLALLSSGGPDGTAEQSTEAPVKTSFILGDSGVHEGIDVAVRSMTVGEVAKFTMAPRRCAAKKGVSVGALSVGDQVSVWEITLEKFVTWTDLDRNGEKLQKIHEEGYGSFPEPLSEVFMHYRVFSHDGSMLHSSRYTVSIGGEGGMKQVEDEDLPAQSFVFGERCWEPLSVLCKSLRQGGVGELRMKRVPPLPKDESADSSANTSAQLSKMLQRRRGGDEDWRQCTVRAELERVVPALLGPEDPRWEGVATLVQERFRAEQLIERGAEQAALPRLRRVVTWASQMLDSDGTSAATELASARASIGWILACQAAAILDAGNVSGSLVAAANRDLTEAEEHCAWLEQHHPNHMGTRLIRAKILVAQEDDFEGAHRQLLEAQRVAPDDKRVQEELKKVKVELRRSEEEKSRAKVVEIRENLKRARTETSDETQRESAVLDLLRELNETHVSWDTVMETRIGVELKHCQDGCGDEAKRLCIQILGRFKDESKEQRPMWDS